MSKVAPYPADSVSVITLNAIADSAAGAPNKLLFVGAGLIPEIAWCRIARSLALSDRELQIVRATFDDQKEAVIAATLGIRPRTVHTHVERLHRKLAVADRPQLILRILAEFLNLTTGSASDLPPICAARYAGRCPLDPSRRRLATSV
jgi:DNA-binding CsgD family transcriptional regulator